MQVKEIFDYVYTVLDHKPSNDEYEDELYRLLNELYFDIFTSRNWTFAQKTIRLQVYADDSITANVTKNDRAVVSTGNILTRYEGLTIEFSSQPGTEYTIGLVEDSDKMYLTEDYTGDTTTGTTATIKQRYITMPDDCVGIFDISRRTWTTTDSDRRQHTPIAQAQDEDWQLELDRTGTPYLWLYGPTFHMPSPIIALTSAAAAGTNWDAGTYTLGYAYIWGGRYSALSPTTSQILTGSNGSPQITWPDIGSNRYLSKQLFVKNAGEEVFRLYTDSANAYTGKVESGYTGPDTLGTEPNDQHGNPEGGWELRDRLPESDGEYLRVRMYPRQDEDQELTIRYMYRPNKLLTSYDSPEIPSAHHKVLAFKLLEEFFMKHNQESEAERYRQKAEIELTKMAQRYLSPERLDAVKGGFGLHGPRTRRVGPNYLYSKVTRST